MKQQKSKKTCPSGVPRPVRSSRANDCENDRSRNSVGVNEFDRTQKSKKSKKINRESKAGFHELKIGNVNITTGRDEAKLVQCVIGAKQLKQDITIFTETHKTGSGLIDDWPEHAKLDGWKLCYTGFDREARAGVAIAVSEKCEILDWGIIEKARIIYVRLKVLGVKMQLFGVYSPTNMKTDEIKSDFYTKLDRSVIKYKKEYPSFPTATIGDFNSTIGYDSPSSTYIGQNNEDYATTDNGLRI